MATRPPRRRPFAGQIHDELPPSHNGPFGGPMLPLAGDDAAVLGPTVVRAATGAALDRLEPVRKRVDALGRRTQSKLLVAAGVPITGAAWALAIFGKSFVAALPVDLMWLPWVPQFLGPALLVYGVLLGLAPDVAPPAPTPGADRFGGVLAETQADARWKMRLLSIATGLMHVALVAALA